MPSLQPHAPPHIRCSSILGIRFQHWQGKSTLEIQFRVRSRPPISLQSLRSRSLSALFPLFWQINTYRFRMPDIRNQAAWECICHDGNAECCCSYMYKEQWCDMALRVAQISVLNNRCPWKERGVLRSFFRSPASHLDSSCLVVSCVDVPCSFNVWRLPTYSRNMPLGRLQSTIHSQGMLHLQSNP